MFFYNKRPIGIDDGPFLLRVLEPIFQAGGHVGVRFAFHVMTQRAEHLPLSGREVQPQVRYSPIRTHTVIVQVKRPIHAGHTHLDIVRVRKLAVPHDPRHQVQPCLTTPGVSPRYKLPHTTFHRHPVVGRYRQAECFVFFVAPLIICHRV